MSKKVLQTPFIFRGQEITRDGGGGGGGGNKLPRSEGRAGDFLASSGGPRPEDSRFDAGDDHDDSGTAQRHPQLPDEDAVGDIVIRIGFWQVCRPVMVVIRSVAYGETNDHTPTERVGCDFLRLPCEVLDPVVRNQLLVSSFCIDYHLPVRSVRG
ncbi:hypothetical protein ZHAS_00015589 [Anopheles sinensis]|uniref:Uncharacterized protein n=1 Tax=Anopheles sinensis TaxID=74873 RepID=A0A084WBM3_ANOSI|nr:hypothetical protein ZHAS_00015589 [Anopheles sinensis]